MMMGAEHPVKRGFLLVVNQLSQDQLSSESDYTGQQCEYSIQLLKISFD